MKQNLKFEPKSCRWGIVIYECESNSNFRILQNVDTKEFWINIRDESSNEWKYPLWCIDKFDTLESAIECLSKHNLEHANYLNASTDNENELFADFEDAMSMLGFTLSEDSYYTQSDIVYEDNSLPGLNMRCVYDQGTIYMTVKTSDNKTVKQFTKDITRMIRFFERFIVKYSETKSIYSHAYMTSVEDRNQYNIEAGISTRDMMKNLVRVKSSNMWGMAMNIKNRKDRFGDVIVQFKGKNGGPGDIYQYFDVPVPLYRRWIGATSKGHFFWQYIRDNFKYRKLTGDKRGRLPNAVN